MTDDDGTRYKPGDLVNGYILGTDGEWHASAFSDPAPPVSPTFQLVEKPPKKSPLVPIVAIIAGLIALLVVVGAVMSLSDASDEPVTRPTPTEVPTPDQPAPTQDSVYDDEYEAVQNVLDTAFRKSDADMTGVCFSWTIDREKWTRKFVNQSATTLDVDWDTAADAVQDWFDEKCRNY